MTTIAYDGKAIASDRRATWDNEPCPHPESKLSLFSFNGRRFIVGRSGFPNQAMRLFNHFLTAQRFGGLTYPYCRIGDERATLLVVELLPDYCHRATLIDTGGGETDVTDCPAAIGSGASYALGAMDAGAAAVRAVEIASRRNVHCGDGCDSFTIAHAHDYQADDFPAFISGG